MCKYLDNYYLYLYNFVQHMVSFYLKITKITKKYFPREIDVEFHFM